MNQQGAALLTGLVLLTALAMIAFTASSGMTLQGRISSNNEQRRLALAQAVVVERHVASWLAGLNSVDRSAHCGASVLQPPGVLDSSTDLRTAEYQPESWWRQRTTT